MITCKLAGGLGNQLFQVATTLAVAWENNDDAVFNLKSSYQRSKSTNYYQETFYRSLIDKKVWFPHVFKEKNHFYSPIAYHPKMKLSGYFQSEKYFIKYRDSILKLFLPPPLIKEKLDYIYSSKLNHPQCAIHVRRGDYLKYPKHHPICSLDYYIQAMAQFEQNTSYVVFSDDLDWCRNQSIFNRDCFSFWKGDRDDLDLYLMSMCPHQIIANSSFSWWASWLNTNPYKKVIAPSIWFGEKLKNLDTKDLYTNYMIKI